MAYKGFNKDMTCTLGRGRFKYEIGKTYQEAEAKCTHNGFHCVEEPIEVLRWYRKGRWCAVLCGGDINEDGNNKISCTEITILKEITLQQLARLECEWIIQHPERAMSSEVWTERGSAKKDGIVIVRGKNPKASGAMGSIIFLLKEEKNSPRIAEAGAFAIDGVDYMPGQFYRVNGRRCR